MRVVSDVAFIVGVVLVVVGAAAKVVGSGHFDVLRARRGAAAPAREPGRGARSTLLTTVGVALLAVALAAAVLA
ncbi:hypothetical protein [Xylanimonas protaetiae]|uniref:Uncharacterized protein n=1 Tax=Xylanimonas protaetiae TaxID=2509457 RepID=A0A4P6F510_9MICO|nr:hypothetical protein [Xylanimonas protaetiae]QAY70772.1 hypothetical protein ET471_12700 [Xylanimonas protaetiae]